MRINNINSYNTHTKNNINFKKGLPQWFIEETKRINPQKIELELLDKDIDASFSGNHVIAACYKKTVEIMNNYGFQLPNRIRLEKLPNDTAGYFFIYSNKLNKISINKNCKHFNDLNKLNSFEESETSYDWSPQTGHFLDTYLHEFTHVAHYKNICQRYGIKESLEIWDKLHNYEPNQIMLGLLYGLSQKFSFNNKKLANIIHIFIKTKNGEYAKTNLVEYIAEKNARLITEDLGKDLTIKNENQPPILNPQNYYNKFEKILSKLNLPFSKDLLELTTKYDKAIWNGELDKLDDLLKHK